MKWWQGGLAVVAVAAGPGGAMQAQAADDGVQLEEIVVTADRRGSYSADYVQAGTFRDARQLDTPLTINVLTEEMLNAQLAISVSDALRNTAGVSTAAISTTVYSNLSIRGIPIENRGNWRLNGSLPIVNLIDIPLENKTRVEALKGASALYYGFSAPSGIINLVSKRATEEPINSLRIFGNNHGTYGAHVDFARSSEKIGIRINALASDLENGVDNTEGKRAFASAAIDIRPNDNLTVFIDAEYIYKTITEPTTLRPINTPDGPVLPELLGASRNLGSEWFKSPAKEFNLQTRIQYRFSDAWALRADAGISYLTRDRRFSLFSFTDGVTGDGNLSVELANGNSYQNIFLRTELAGAFETGPLKHELVVGIASNTRDSNNPQLSFANYSQNYFNPVLVPETPLPDRVIPNPSQIKDLGIYAFDRISYQDWLQVTLGIRKTDYEDVSASSTFEANPTSLSGGVLVKPLEWLSVYATYIEGLENSRVAPSTTVNAGESLPAAISEQLEFGIKGELMSGLLATVAYFDIDRESSFTNSSNVFVLDGLANYKGLEFSLTGEVTPEFSVFASALILDTEQVSGSSNLGNDIQNSPKFSGSFFVEYRPAALPGFAVSGGLFRVGERAGNAGNTFYVPGYTTFDAGVSYVTDELIGKDTTFRVYWDNITAKRYWAAAGSTLLAQSLPSTVRFSVETSF